jgi:hypothetical protein
MDHQPNEETDATQMDRLFSFVFHLCSLDTANPSAMLIDLSFFFVEV